MVDDGIGKVDRDLAKAFRERIANGRFGNEPEPHQDFAQRGFGLTLLDQRDIQLIGRNNAAREQCLAKRQLGNGGVHLIH